MKMHTLKDEGTGYKSNFVMDLVKGDDRNSFAAVEFAPDGSLYFIDWHKTHRSHAGTVPRPRDPRAWPYLPHHLPRGPWRSPPK